ncbi:MAG: endonuclease/exonuclease/phosphatase family protein [Kofleriaceae bacterium]
MSKTPIRIATLNLLHGFPGFEQLEQRTQMVVDWIALAKPDFIMIQEAHQSPSMANRGQDIATRTGYSWLWEKASGVDFVFEEGPGVLSKTPVLATAALALPHPGMVGFEVRKVVGGEVETPAGRIGVWSTHLTTQADPVIKGDQAMAAHDLVMAPRPVVARVLGGDMNAVPDSLPMKFLRGEATHAGNTGQLDDAWLAVNASQPGFTSAPPSADRRIDYLYVSDEVEVIECKIVLDQPSGALYASDHLGVMCDVRIK